MENILKQILAKLEWLTESQKSLDERLRSLDEPQKELNDVVTAIRHGQEITHAKLEAITMDVRKLQGDMESLKEHEKDMEFVRRIRQAASDMN